jgi:hypothetical protein
MTDDDFTCPHPGNSPFTCQPCLADYMADELILAEYEESLEAECDECARLVGPEDAAPSCGAHRLHIECAAWFICRQCTLEQVIDDDANREPTC